MVRFHGPGWTVLVASFSILGDYNLVVGFSVLGDKGKICALCSKISPVCAQLQASVLGDYDFFQIFSE